MLYVVSLMSIDAGGSFLSVQGPQGGCAPIKKKKQPCDCNVVHVYTCGIWDVITWIRVQQCLCKTGNHFQLQVGPEALVKVPLGSSIVVYNGIYWVRVTFQNVCLSPPPRSSPALHSPSPAFCLSLCQLWRSPYLLILAWETSILGSWARRNCIFWTQSPSPISSIRHTCNLYFPPVLLSTLHHLPAPPPSQNLFSVITA